MSEKKKLPSDNKEKFSWVKVYFASKAVRIISRNQEICRI